MPEHQARWWFIVTSYPCPACGVAPGRPCLTTSGNRKQEPHADRARLASEHDWHEADG